MSQNQYVPHFKEIYNMVYSLYSEAMSPNQEPLRSISMTKANTCFETLKEMKKEGIFAPHTAKLIFEDLTEAILRVNYETPKNRDRIQIDFVYTASNLLAAFRN